MAKFLTKEAQALREQDTGGYSVSPPNTRTATSHSIIIRTDRGIKIARIQSWAPAQSRTIDAIYEVNAETTGEPIERVPQIVGTNRISVSRYELYSKHIGEAFGVPTLSNKEFGSSAEGGAEDDLFSLALQFKPFNIREIWRDPFGGIRAYAYLKAWFSDWGVTISATDDRIIKANATIEFTRRIRLN